MELPGETFEQFPGDTDSKDCSSDRQGGGYSGRDDSGDCRDDASVIDGHDFLPQIEFNQLFRLVIILLDVQTRNQGRSPTESPARQSIQLN